MSQNNRTILLLTYVPILIILTSALLMRTWTQHRNSTVKNNPHGRYSAQQILSLSEPMGSALTPDATELQFIPSPLLAQDRAGAQFRKWHVEISDREGNTKGTLLWDADTGLVEQVSRGPLSSRPRTSGNITCVEAVEASLRWLVTLHMVEEKMWRLETTPEYVRGQWQCRFLSPSARVYVSVESSDGQLVFARTYPVLSHSLRPGNVPMKSSVKREPFQGGEE
jgi:hypothetical protein